MSASAAATPARAAAPLSGAAEATASQRARRQRRFLNPLLVLGLVIVGLMTQALEVTKRCKVLEIGTGSGYQAAILARLARRVYTIERHRRLARRAREVFQKLGLHNITVVHGDGSLGLPEQAPFDRIIVTAAAEDAPQPLLDQLRPGGIMVLPVGQSNAVQTLIRIVKGEHGLEYTDLGAVRFVPLVEGVAQDVLD